MPQISRTGLVHQLDHGLPSRAEDFIAPGSKQNPALLSMGQRTTLGPSRG